MKLSGLLRLFKSALVFGVALVVVAHIVEKVTGQSYKEHELLTICVSVFSTIALITVVTKSRLKNRDF